MTICNEVGLFCFYPSKAWVIIPTHKALEGGSCKPPPITHVETIPIYKHSLPLIFFLIFSFEGARPLKGTKKSFRNELHTPFSPYFDTLHK